MQVKKLVGVGSVLVRPGHRKTFMEAAGSVSTIFDSSPGCSAPAVNFFIVENEIVEEKSHWNLKDFTSKNDRGLSALWGV